MEAAKILELVEGGQVFAFAPEHFKDRLMTIAEVEAIFGYFDAFWQYKGQPCADKPHALLKSKMHSNGFIMCKEVLDHPSVCLLFANEMLKIIEEHYYTGDLREIGFVASSAYSAISLGWCLAWLLGEKYNYQVKHVIVEKDKNGAPTIIRGGLDPKLTGLVINELMTTKEGSTWETKKAVLECNKDKEDKTPPKVLDKSFVLMHRSLDYELEDGSQVVPVFHFDINNFDVPAGRPCPFCEAGSEAIKPKQGNNWQRLHGLA